MNRSVRDHLIHAMLAMLMSAGLLMPLLGILDPSFLKPDVLLWSAAVVLLFELLSFRPVAAYIAAFLIPLSLAGYLLAAGRITVFSDVITAVILRFRGIDTSLPLVASSAVAGLTVLVTLLGFFSTMRNVPVLPASCLCFGMILLIYLSGSDHLIPWFLPALAALLLLLMTDRFPETSLLHLFPFAVLLVAGAFLLTQGGIDSKPLRDKADEMRQALMDRLFFTEPRDVFSLSSEGYYPEGQDQLGGKPDPDTDPVMQVSTPRITYLRGVVFNEYTGRNWQNTTGGRRYLRESVRLSNERSLLFDEDLPPLTVRNALCDPVTVSVRMLNDSASTLFVPQRVRDLSPGGDLVPYFSNSSELFVTRNLKAGDTYSISAPLFLAGDSGLSTLIEVCSTLEDSRYDRMVENYTTLPSHLEEPVYDLAREVASAASSPYDRALALQSWLSRSFRYTLDVDRQPSDVDFVTRFLLETKEGYCTYFASAMTVLCRMIGLPARYVEGYLAEPDENGEAIVTGLSAHAWTEVYFRGFGWLTFDATPRASAGNGSGTEDRQNQHPSPTPSPSPSPEPTPSPTPDQPEGAGTENQSAPPSDTPSPEPENTPEPSDRPDQDSPSPPPDPESLPQEKQDSSGSFPWLWILLFLLLIAVLLRFLFSSPVFRARRAKTESARFDVWAQEITDLLHAENLDRKTGETPMAFGRRVDRAGLFSVALSPVGECVSLIRYSRVDVTETDTGLLRDTSILLRSDLSRPARLRYLIRRFFVPVKRRHSL